MLLTHSLFSFTSSNISLPKYKGTLSSKLVSHEIKFSFEKCGKPKFTSLFHSDKNKCLKRNQWQTPVYNGYPCFPSLHHPLELDLLRDESGCDANLGGIEVFKFFQEKNIFITGATGLVGKASTEKLLRSTSVGKIYLLIKAEENGTALNRLEKEITQSELFECLREKHGNSYEEFVSKKLIAVEGNICEPNLGMDYDSARAIMEDVDVIIGSAASTTLNDRYDLSLDLNVNATQRLMRFGKTCKKLKLFVHLSTAYVCGRREGLIWEKPLAIGGNGINKDDNKISPSPIPPLDVANEISLIMKSCRASLGSNETKDLKTLGLERANLFGWFNTYHMTKAMAEMVLDEMRGDTPVLIMRPTVIESSYNEPIPGWIQGNRMYDPVIISYGRGQLPAFLGDPEIHMDIIPVDMVVNTTIAAIAKHGRSHMPQLNVYHVSSGVVNPISFSDFFEIIHEYFNRTPLDGSTSISKIKYSKNFNDFSKYIRDEMFQVQTSQMNNSHDMDDEMIRKIRKQYKAKVVYAEQLCKMYEFIGFFKGRFDTGNAQKLLKEMSEEEKNEFEIDARNIDWRKYLLDIHIPGLMKHVINRMKRMVV